MLLAEDKKILEELKNLDIHTGNYNGNMTFSDNEKIKTLYNISQILSNNNRNQKLVATDVLQEYILKTLKIKSSDNKALYMFAKHILKYTKWLKDYLLTYFYRPDVPMDYKPLLFPQITSLSTLGKVGYANARQCDEDYVYCSGNSKHIKSINNTLYHLYIKPNKYFNQLIEENDFRLFTGFSHIEIFNDCNGYTLIIAVGRECISRSYITSIKTEELEKELEEIEILP